jgi:prepilin-type N-terminal cleavage/methylation domain-containing protein
MKTRLRRSRWSDPTPGVPSQETPNRFANDQRQRPTERRLQVKRLSLTLVSPAFSLLEVVAAVAIFAIGMVAVLGLFAPVTKSVSTLSDSEAAARVADAVRARLQALPFDKALALVQESADVRKKDGDGTYNPNDGTKYPAVIFGKLSGDVGIYATAENRPGWYDSSVPTPRIVENADKFFEVDLIRNDALSPKANDPTAAMVAFTLRVRWPAFMPASSGPAVQVGANPGGGGPVPYDHGRKQVLFFTGSISR